MTSSLQSRRGGALGKLIVLLLVLSAAVTLGWMLALPGLVAGTLTNRSQFPTTVAQLAFNPFSGRFHGGGVEINNPGRWGGGRFVEISAFAGRVQTMTATKEELVVEELTVDLSHLIIVLTADGQTNAQAFGDGFAVRLPAADAAESRRMVASFPGVGEGPKSVLVKRLRLRVGKIELLQPDRKGLERVAEQLDFVGEYQDVRQLEDLLSGPLLARLAQSPALWKIILSSDLLPADAKTPSGLRRLLDRAGNVLNSLFGTLEQTPDP